MASLFGGRTAFIAFSVVAHGFMVLGIEQIDAKKSHAATAIQIAQSKPKPAKKPETKLEPPPKKPDFSTVTPAFRTALGAANCDFLEALQSGALPIGSLPSPTVNGVTADIQDCGPLHDGNHQIHPSTSATCDQ